MMMTGEDGRKSVFVSYPQEDGGRIAPLLQALDAWGVTYTTAGQRAGQEQLLTERSQMAIAACDVFLRLCTVNTGRSYWQSLETGAVLALLAEDHRQQRVNQRTLVNVIVDEHYQREPFDSSTVVIDSTRTPASVWINQLRTSLGLPFLEPVVPIVFPRPPRVISRRVVVGAAAASVATLAVVGATGALVVSHQTPATIFSAPTPTPTPPHRSNKPLWSFRADSEVAVQVVVGNGIAYACSLDAKVYAIDLATHQPRWTYQTQGKAIYAAPLLANGVVYVPSNDDGLYALDAATGQQKWYTKLNDVFEGFGFSTPVLADGMLYLGNYNGGVLVGVDPKDGNAFPGSAPGFFTSSTPAIVNGIAYLGETEENDTDGFLYALDVRKGFAVVWQVATGAIKGSSSATLAGGIVYIGSQDHNIYAVNAATGKVAWKYATGDAISTTPTVVGNILYIGCDDHYVYALDATSKQLRWRYETGGKVRSSPTVHNGVVYIGSNDNFLYALDASTGKLIQRFETGNLVHSQPNVVDNVVYVGSNDHYVYAFAPVA